MKKIFAIVAISLVGFGACAGTSAVENCVDKRIEAQKNGFEDADTATRRCLDNID